MEAEKHFTEAKGLQPGTTVEHIFAVIEQPVWEQAAVLLSSPSSQLESRGHHIRLQDSCAGRRCQPILCFVEPNNGRQPNNSCQLTCAGSRDFRAEVARECFSTSNHVCIGHGSVRFGELLKYDRSFADWIAPSEKGAGDAFDVLGGRPSDEDTAAASSRTAAHFPFDVIDDVLFMMVAFGHHPPCWFP